MSVPELCHRLQHLVEHSFPEEVWVRGAISGLNRSSGGHVYFDLIDPDELGRRAENVLPVALFANAKFRVNAILKKSNNTRMADGIEIRIRGKLAYYGPQSRMQLLMTLIDPAFTMGQMEMARTRVLAALGAEGLLDRNRQVSRPILPLRIALITSANSAAAADFLDELDASRLPFEVALFDARVQGPEAAAMLAASVEGAADTDADVIAMVRGGGAKSDLLAFDDELLARAIAASPLPVFVGIGHETDTSVADHVAHLATKTPTACAGALIDAVRSFIERIDRAESDLNRALDRILRNHTARLDRAGGQIGRLAAGAVATHQAHLGRIEDRTLASVERGLERAEERLERAQLRADALDPARTLARGWSITRTADGELVRDAADVAAGTTLITTLQSGRITSVRSAETVPPPASTEEAP